MRTLLSGLFLLLFMVAAQAQALVVQTCGTLPLAYAVGSTQLQTVDVNGRQCNSGGTISGSFTAGDLLAASSSGQVLDSSAFTTSGVNLPAALTVNGGAFPTFTANGQAALGTSATNGLILGGQGSTNDLTIVNSAGAAVIDILTGSQTVNFVGQSYINLTSTGGRLQFRNGFTFLQSPAAATMQQGNYDAATATAQTTQVQSVLAGTSNTGGANWTLIGSLSTGSGTSGDIIFKTGGMGATATSVNAAATAFTIKGATQGVIMSQQATTQGATWMTGLATSSGTQVSFLCRDANNQIIADTGATCVASSRRFKEFIEPIESALSSVIKMIPVSFSYKKTGNDVLDNSPNHKFRQVGFIAEDAEKVDRRLVTYDAEGQVNGFRYGNYVAVLTKAIQEQQIQINDLKYALKHRRK